MIRKDLQALTLVGPTRENPVLDPLAVQHLDNLLYIWKVSGNQNPSEKYFNNLETYLRPVLFRIALSEFFFHL